MKRVLTAVVLVPLVLLVVFKAPLWVFTVVVGLVILLCLHEYLGIVEQYGIEPVRWPAYILSILLVVATFMLISEQYGGHRRYAIYAWAPEIAHWTLLLLIPLILGIPVVFRREMRMALSASAASAFGVLYIAVPLVLLISITFTWGYSILTIFVLLAVWAGDIAAYYVGKTIGRHKLAPVVSPNKTWEGAIASVLASAIVALVVFHFAKQINAMFRPLPSFYSDDFGSELRLHRAPSPLLVSSLGVVTNIAAQFGDLFESAIKRGAQVKDSGSLLPGHGGFLDRIDALLFAIPAVWYYAKLIELFHS